MAEEAVTDGDVIAFTPGFAASAIAVNVAPTLAAKPVPMVLIVGPSRPATETDER